MSQAKTDVRIPSDTFGVKECSIIIYSNFEKSPRIKNMKVQKVNFVNLKVLTTALNKKNPFFTEKNSGI